MSKQPTPGVHENMAEALASPAEVVGTPPPQTRGVGADIRTLSQKKGADDV